MRTLLFACILASSLTSSAGAGPTSQQPPSNGPKATAIRSTRLYVSPDTSADHLAEIAPGREMVILDRNGPWLKVFANTDVETFQTEDAPVFGGQTDTPPVSGWMEAKGIVDATTAGGDLILFGAAASSELDASQPHAPPGEAQAAWLLYRRVAEIFPQSDLAPEAAWRSADIRWQLQKADVFSLPSAHEADPGLREQIDETQMRKLQKMYPNSRWADLAAWDMLDNKVCGDWRGSTKCPEKEAVFYAKYAQEHPNSPKAPQALYEACYRQGVLSDMLNGNGDGKQASEAQARAASLAALLQSKYPESDYTARAAALVYKLQVSIPIFGNESE